MSAIVHLSIPVRDLAEAEAFYVGVLGAEVGRRRDAWLDVWLFGAQITLHAAPDALLPVDKQGHRHFGAVLARSQWEALAARIAAADPYFVRPIQTDDVGSPQEQSKLMIADPSGNHIELKTYPNPAAALERPALAPFRIFGDGNSGNCLKVKWIADALGLAYDWTEVDVLAGGSRTPEMLTLNPAGQVPFVVFADGRTLAQSNAILRYLARGSRYLPDDPLRQANIDAWLFWEQNTHEPYVAGARFHMRYLGKPKESLDPRVVARGNDALDYLAAVVSTNPWLANGAPSIADIALVAYTRVADEGGFDLSARPSLRRWIAACEAEFRILEKASP